MRGLILMAQHKAHLMHLKTVESKLQVVYSVEKLKIKALVSIPKSKLKNENVKNKIISFIPYVFTSLKKNFKIIFLAFYDLYGF